MLPLLRSGQGYWLAPATWEECEVDDIVYCKCRGKYITNIIKQKHQVKGCLVGDNKGDIIGWTMNIYGKVIKKLA